VRRTARLVVRSGPDEYYVPLPQTEGRIFRNHWICVSRGPLFQILSLRPMDWKKSKFMVVAPMMAMLAPFLKSPLACWDAGGSGRPKCSAARTYVNLIDIRSLVVVSSESIIPTRSW
jgi:hypothetical protein